MKRKRRILKHKISKAIFAVVSCGLVIQGAFPMQAANAYPLTGQDYSTVDAQKEIFYVPNVRMEQVPAELLDDASAENPAEGLEEDSVVSPHAAAAEWRITSAADWEALLSGAKSSDWSDGSYTGEDDVTIILEADIVTARDSIYLTKEDITFILDLNKHSLRSSAGIIHVNSTNDTGTKRIENSFVLCNGKIVNTCIDTANAMKNVDIHGVDFTDMNTNAVSGASSTSFSSAYSIQDCSFSHVSGDNTHTAIDVHASGIAGQTVQISNSVIDGFHNGVNCSNNMNNDVLLDNITVSNAYLGVDLSSSFGGKIVNSALSGNQAVGSSGVRCDDFNTISRSEFLYRPFSNMSHVTISGFESGVRNDGNGAFSLDNCEITNVIHGLNCGSGYAQFNIRDSVLSASPSVAAGSYTGDSYGINATVGYCCVNTKVTGFKVGARNTSSSSSIANCTFDNLDCNVNAYCGLVYNSVLKNAAVGYYSNGSIACIIDTMITGRKEPGSIGIHQPLTGTSQNVVYVWDTDVYSTNAAHSDWTMLKAYVEGVHSAAPHYDMCVSGYGTGLQCDNDQIEVVGVEVKNCGTGVKGVQYRSCAANGPDNYIHDCDYGVDCDKMTNMGNLYIYNCKQTGMQIHVNLFNTHLVEIYNCGEGFVFDGQSITGPHLRIHDNTGNGLSYTGNTNASIRATMEIYNNEGWNICGNDLNDFHLSKDYSNEFTCRLENGGLGNMNIRQKASSGAGYMLEMARLKSDEGVYYVYPGKELCISPISDSSWIEPTDWLEGSMVFDTENYTEGAVAAYVPLTYVRTISDEEEDTWDFVRTHFFAAKEGWIIRYDMSAAAGMVGKPLVFTEGCSVTYDYETNGGTSIQSNYEKITYLEGEAVDLSITASRPGYEFLGWSTSPDTHELVSALTAGKKNITLYAVYRKAVTFTYHTYDPSMDYTQNGYMFNREKVPYEDLSGSRALNALSYTEQVPESAYLYAGYSFDGRNKTDLFRGGVIPSGEKTDIYCVYVMNGVLVYLGPDGAVELQQTAEAFYSVLDTLPYQFSYVLYSFRPEKGYAFKGWRDAAGEFYAPGSTYVTNQNPAELQAEVEALLVSSLSVSPKDTTIGIGETLQLSVTIQPEDVLDSTVTWTTSDASIATVDANGLVTAHGEGTVTITATAKDGSGCFDTAAVVVKKAGNASQPKTGDNFPMGAVLLFGCLSMIMVILSISNLGKKRNEGQTGKFRF